MRRRQFIGLLGGAAAAWPLAARAQQRERMRRIGVLASLAADDPQAQARNAAFVQELAQLGWNVGRNLQIDFRWGGGDAARNTSNAAELVALAPDVILTAGTSVLTALLQATRTVPIVFVLVADPVGAGFVASLARPGGNVTGFSQFEYGLSGKWLELLKEITPRVKRAGIIRDPTLSSGIGQFAAIQSAAPLLGVELSPIGVRDAGPTGPCDTGGPWLPSSWPGLGRFGGAVYLIEIRCPLTPPFPRRNSGLPDLRTVMRHPGRPWVDPGFVET
jgi:putative ABC transport system substrate-binding protein